MPEQVAKYEAWIARLETVRADYLGRLPLYRRGFFALTAAGFACFAFGVYPGIWGSMCATFVSACGWFMVKTRVWELTSEIDEVRADRDRLSAAAVSRSSPRP